MKHAGMVLARKLLQLQVHGYPWSGACLELDDRIGMEMHDVT